MIRFLALTLTALLLVSCSDSVTEPEAPAPVASLVMVSDLPADSSGTSGKFTFYSLRDSAIVSSADSNTTKWDIAFRSTTILTNSGVSGPGQGGAMVMNGMDFDALTAAPSSGFAVDTAATKLAIPTGSGNGWYNYNFALNTITPIPGRVIVVRTADGKYAKVQIISYYKGGTTAPTPTDAPRYYTFKYLYQPDGTANLQ